MSQSVRCLNLISVGKRLKKSMQQVLALRQNRFFLNICDYFEKICQKHRDSTSHIERTINILGEGPTKCKYRYPNKFEA